MPQLENAGSCGTGWHSVFYGRGPAYLTATVQSLNASRPHLGQRLR